MNLLNDTSNYKKQIKPYKHQNKNNVLIKKWQNNNFITNEEAKKLLIHNALPPKIYGLPKLHKTNIPLRPIVSVI